MERAKLALVEKRPKEGQEVRIHVLEAIEVKRDGKEYLQFKLKPKTIKPDFVEKKKKDIFQVEVGEHTYILQLVTTRKKSKLYKACEKHIFRLFPELKGEIVHLMLVKNRPILGKKLEGHILGIDKDGMVGFYRDKTTSRAIIVEFEMNVYKVITERKQIYYCICEKDALY